MVAASAMFGLPSYSQAYSGGAATPNQDTALSSRELQRKAMLYSVAKMAVQTKSMMRGAPIALGPFCCGNGHGQSRIVSGEHLTVRSGWGL
jgi:hypothetical protein